MKAICYQRHESVLPTSIMHNGRIMAGDHVDPIKKSPCDCRPDSGEICALRYESKKNEICRTCSFVGRGKMGAGGVIRVWSNDEINTEIENGLLDPDYKKQKPTNYCNWPHGCQTEVKKPGFCPRHKGVFFSRRGSHRRKYGTDGDYEWLTRAIEKRGGNKQLGG